MKQKLINPGKLLAILSMVLVLSACNKDDDENQADYLIGTWNSSGSSFSATINNQAMLQYLIDVMGSTPADAQFSVNLFNLMLQQSFTGTITFKTDNTYTSTLGGQTEDGTWTLSSDIKKLTIDPSTGGAVVFDVAQLTPSTLQIQTEETFMDDVNEDEIPETIVADVDLTFTKQ